MQSSFLTQFRKHVLAFFATIYISITALSQDNYRIIHWDLEQGLSFGMANCMIKDQLGFVYRQGTGLGLSLSFDIIKAHVGEIVVDSRENEFAEFIIRLPVKPSISPKSDTLVNANNS